MNNKFRVIAIGIVLVVVISLLFLVVPVTTHFIIAYVFSLLGILGLILSTVLLAGKNLNIPQSIPLFSTAWQYLLVNLLFSLAGNFLSEFLSPLWFTLIHIFILAGFVIFLIVLSGGKEYIDQKNVRVKEKVLDIRVLLAHLDAIKDNLTELAADDRQVVEHELNTIYDALRYSDPISHARLTDYDNAIKESVILLDQAVSAGELETIKSVSLKIQKQIKDRNNQIKLMK